MKPTKEIEKPWRKIFKKKSECRPSFAGDCDINNIMEKAIKYGTPPTSDKVGAFRDCTHGMDFFAMHLRVRQANEAFMTLPAQIRDRFDNSPGKLINFLNDVKNMEEAVKLGLVNKPAGVSVPPVPPADNKEGKNGN